MHIEPGDTLDLFSCQVNGCYLHGANWVAHSARPGSYRVLDVLDQTVLLGIERRVKGGMDVFRCSMDSLRAVVMDHCHMKREAADKITASALYLFNGCEAFMAMAYPTVGQEMSYETAQDIQKTRAFVRAALNNAT